MPSYDGENPTKPEDSNGIYIFTGWSPAISTVTGNVLYTAQYSVKHKYTVTWKNYDDTVLETDTDVLEGTTPTYDGETPTKPEDNQGVYIFTGWSPAVSAVTGDVTYTAVFSSGDKCGENAYWAFDETTGTLIISGSGEMYDYSYKGSTDNFAPWFELASQIKVVEIDTGITKLGNYAFLKCNGITDVYFNGTKSQWDAVSNKKGAVIPSAAVIHYDEDPIYSITISECEHCTITADKETATEGETVILKISTDKEYWFRSVKCNGIELTKDPKGRYYFTMPASEAVVTVEVFKYTLVPAKEATCTEAGNISYYSGSDGYYYLYENNTFVETTLEAVTINATGHDWSVPEYSWTATENGFKCTAIRTCNNGNHSETEEVIAAYAVVTEPTADAKGLGRYTATFTNTAFDVQTKDVDIDPKSIINAANITLGGELGLNFYLTIPDVLVNEGAKVVMNGPEGEKEVVLSTLTKDDKGRYKITYKLKAIFADRDVSLKITSSNGDELPMYKESGDRIENNVLTYSIYDYVESSKNYTALTDNDRKIINAMYTYAAYSAKWKYHTDVPAGTDELPEITQAQFEKYALKQSGSSEGIKLTGAALVLDSNTAFRLYFTSSEDVSEHTIKLGDTVLIPHETSTTGKYYVDIENIGAGNLKTDYTVSFDNSYSVTVSAMTYVYNYLRSGMSDAELYDLLKALYAYSEAVNPTNES